MRTWINKLATKLDSTINNVENVHYKYFLITKNGNVIRKSHNEESLKKLKNELKEEGFETYIVKDYIGADALESTKEFAGNVSSMIKKSSKKVINNTKNTKDNIINFSKHMVKAYKEGYKEGYKQYKDT